MDGAGDDREDDTFALPTEIANRVGSDPDIATVGELSQELKALVADADGVHHDYVVGDVTGPSTSSSGHLYFTLEDGSCELGCVVFEHRRSRLATEPEDDVRVLVAGDLQYYADRGRMSLQVTECHELGEGSYSEVYQETKSKLEAEGLFDDDHKQSLPRLPGKIGLVTSKHGDAVDDAIESIHGRYPDIDIEIAHATVQGDDALESLVTRIARLDEDPSIDLIVVTRGGGAESTLRTFDELAVCRTVARTETPIAAGIGHENDRTLTDQVADERIMTPTDAGTLVPDRPVLEDRHERLGERLTTAYRSVVESELSALSRRHRTAYDRSVATRLKQLESDLDRATDQVTETTLRDRQAALDSAYTSLVERYLTATESQLTAATRQHTRSRLYELTTQLERAYDRFEREREYEAQLETATTEARQEAQTRERAYQAAIAVLMLALLAVLVVTFVL